MNDYERTFQPISITRETPRGDLLTSLSQRVFRFTFFHIFNYDNETLKLYNFLFKNILDNHRQNLHFSSQAM